MKAALLLALLPCAGAFVAPVPRAQRSMRMAAAGSDDSWRNIVGSEANLAKYLGEAGFRYNLNKNSAEIESEGDYGLLERMFGATSNNAARLAAKAAARATTIEAYDGKKAAENKEWIAKYGYKRWGMSYIDKANLDAEKGVKGGAAPAAAAPKAAAPKAAAPKPALSLSFGGAKPAVKPTVKVPTPAAAPKAVSVPKVTLPKAAPAAAAPKVTIPKAAPAAAAPKVTIPKAAPKAAAPAPTPASKPAPKAAAPAPAAPKPAPKALSPAPKAAPAKPAGNLSFLKKPTSGGKK